ncbi:NUDIX domain-containing protein [Yoonia litorea]|uniref:Putative gamma-glutamylcyclotransferase n=1 Tax=Yoonia litorea TaxID=1123755 RepID=A0A1I6M7I9_9RHOB|nr:NUDIX domain-containing protein [Yoonia litorea]SFS11482.1 nudix-type nucleoside diphosphatase, YffH/AdpP family [Yoonia litorea]
MDLFVYGTLRSTALMAAVAGDGPLDPVTAYLEGFAVFPLKGNVVPFIRAASDGQRAEGVIWRNLTHQQIARLDLYEGAFGYRTEPVTVTTEDGPVDVLVYMPPDDLVAGDGAWSLTSWEAGHLVPGVLAAQELFAHDPLPDQGMLRTMWPMIEARAWAKFRASAAPATRRYEPETGDLQLQPLSPPHGQFFRYQSFNMSHRRFDGTRADDLRREAFWGIDATFVLPYDPKRDRVLLVEQTRIGPALRQDPNPWMLEPIAGIIDARETPEGAALREAEEEAGLTDVTLHPAGNFYISPGNVTDYFYTFLGLCDLPHQTPYLGGLDSEAEDLRLHPVDYAEALRLADTGEIATAPALHLIYWLERNRDRFRDHAG